ncbi:hypothetical protein [Devosia soli]|nr:hypothetical protein [Devosia soli]
MFDPSNLTAALPELLAGAGNTVGLAAAAMLLSWVVGAIVVVGLLAPVAL